MSDIPENIPSDANSPGSIAAQTSPDYDGAWKNALDAYFPSFMALLWPSLHAQIDWKYKPVFLDKELQKLAASTKHGRLHVDKLVSLAVLTHRSGEPSTQTYMNGALNTTR